MDESTKTDVKQEIAEALQLWLTETTRLKQHEIELYTHPSHESYLTIEVSPSTAADFNGFDKEAVRREVKERTPYRAESVSTDGGIILNVVPDFSSA